jgi:hypothetical protein
MRSKLFYVVVLVTAFFLDGIVIFVFPEAGTRVVLSLLFLIPIIWAADALGIAEMISDLPRTHVRNRQYGALRSNVRLLLDVVRRIHWLAVDLERGIRNASEVQEEMDQAHGKMQRIVDDIRISAGRASADPEVLATPDLMLDDGPPEGVATSTDEPPEER